MDTKSDPEIDASTIRGSTFQVLGGFLRCLTFDECRWQRIDITGGGTGAGEPPPFGLGGGIPFSIVKYYPVYPPQYIYPPYISGIHFGIIAKGKITEGKIAKGNITKG